jgi:hypothetical protein
MEDFRLVSSASNIEMKGWNINYLLTYDSYGPVHNRFHRGRMHYLGQWGGGGPGHSWALTWHRANMCDMYPIDGTHLNFNHLGAMST